MNPQPSPFDTTPVLERPTNRAQTGGIVPDLRGFRWQQEGDGNLWVARSNYVRKLSSAETLGLAKSTLTIASGVWSTAMDAARVGYTLFRANKPLKVYGFRLPMVSPAAGISMNLGLKAQIYIPFGGGGPFDYLPGERLGNMQTLTENSWTVASSFWTEVSFQMDSPVIIPKGQDFWLATNWETVLPNDTIVEIRDVGTTSGQNFGVLTDWGESADRTYSSLAYGDYSHYALANILTGGGPTGTDFAIRLQNRELMATASNPVRQNAAFNWYAVAEELD